MRRMFALGCVFTLGCVLVTLVGPSGCATQMDFSDAKVAAQLPEPLLDSSQRTRFAVVGDIGVDDDGMQRAIAFRVRALCEAAETRCDFILANGDNLYPSGFADHNAASRLRRLLDNYGPTPKYLVLGNHDYHPVIHDLDVAREELAFIRETAGVFGGAHFWQLQAGPIDIVGIDTDYMVRGKGHSETDTGLRQWMKTVFSPPERWRLVLGHHPYLSNGKHGNAGSYLGYSGVHFQRLFEEFIREQAHLYVSGHDHHMEFYTSAGPNDNLRSTALAVIGSSAKCRGRGGASNPLDTGVSPSVERYGFGFAWVEATKGRLTIQYFDVNGAKFFEATRTRDGTWSVPATTNEQAGPIERCECERAAIEANKRADCSAVVR